MSDKDRIDPCGCRSSNNKISLCPEHRLSLDDMSEMLSAELHLPPWIAEKLRGVQSDGEVRVRLEFVEGRIVDIDIEPR